MTPGSVCRRRRWSYHVHTLSPPVINHVPVVAAEAGKNVEIGWQFNCSADTESLCQSTLHFRNGADLLPLPGRPFTEFNPRTCRDCSWASTPVTNPTTGARFFLIDATVVLHPEEATQNSGQYYLYATDGKTKAYSPGSTYEGYVIPADGVNVGEFEPYTFYLYGPHARSDTNGLEDFYPYHAWDLGTGKAYANMATGNLVVQSTDLDVPGQGLNLRLTRTYNAHAQGEKGRSAPGGRWASSTGTVWWTGCSRR